jgi:hypothetical protein
MVVSRLWFRRSTIHQGSISRTMSQRWPGHATDGDWRRSFKSDGFAILGLFHRHDHPAVEGRGENISELVAKPLKGGSVDHQRIVRVQLDLQAVAGRARPVVMFKIAHQVDGVVQRDSIRFNKRRKNGSLRSISRRRMVEPRTFTRGRSRPFC